MNMNTEARIFGSDLRFNIGAEVEHELQPHHCLEPLVENEFVNMQENTQGNWPCEGMLYASKESLFKSIKNIQKYRASLWLVGQLKAISILYLFVLDLETTCLNL